MKSRREVGVPILVVAPDEGSLVCPFGKTLQLPVDVVHRHSVGVRQAVTSAGVSTSSNT